MENVIVYHSVLGRGVAQFSRKNGLEHQVRFDSAIVRWVRTDELDTTPPALSTTAAVTKTSTTVGTFAASTSAPETVASSTPAVGAIPSTSSSYGPRPLMRAVRVPADNFRHRKVIEALRIGIVPDEGLKLFTHGREHEVRALEQWLRQENGGAHLVVGTYGSGKTHLLNYFRMHALTQGYAVALVEMDALESPFSMPKRVYSQVTRALEWVDPTTNTRRHFRQLIQRGLGLRLLRTHKYFTYVTETSDARVWEWIDGTSGAIRPMMYYGSDTRYPPLYDYTTAANIYCYLLSTLGSICRGVGLRGLLILFDESEALYAARSAFAWNRSVNFLDALLCTARGDSNLLDWPQASGFKYANNAPDVPFLYAQPSGLKLLFAFTSVNDRWISQELAEVPYLLLEPLTHAHLDATLDQLTRVYITAYAERPGKLDPELLADMLTGRTYSSTREVVKSFIEALDLTRFGTYDPDEEEEQ